MNDPELLIGERAAGGAPGPHGAAARALYDRLWTGDWRLVHESGPLSRAKRRLVLRALGRLAPFPEGTRVLDAGCGDGSLLAAIGDRFGLTHLDGFDLSPHALEGSVHAPRIRNLAASDLCAAGALSSGPYDLVVTTDVLEHVPEPDAALRNLRAVSAPGALLLALVPHRRRYWNAEDDRAGHFRRYEKDELRTALVRGGFTVERLETWGWPMARLYQRALPRAAPAAFAASSRAPAARLAVLAAARLIDLLLRADDRLSTGRGIELLALARAAAGHPTVNPRLDGQASAP